MTASLPRPEQLSLLDADEHQEAATSHQKAAKALDGENTSTSIGTQNSLETSEPAAARALTDVLCFYFSGGRW